MRNVGVRDRRWCTEDSVNHRVKRGKRTAPPGFHAADNVTTTAAGGVRGGVRFV